MPRPCEKMLSKEGSGSQGRFGKAENVLEDKNVLEGREMLED